MSVFLDTDKNDQGKSSAVFVYLYHQALWQTFQFTFAIPVLYGANSWPGQFPEALTACNAAIAALLRLCECVGGADDVKARWADRPLFVFAKPKFA